MAVTSFTPTLLKPTGFLPSSDGAIFTIGGTGNGAVLRKVLLTNVTGSGVGVTLYYVASAGAAASSNILLPSITIPAYSTYIVNELQAMVLNTNDGIWGFAASASAITITASGFMF